jgi:hypothetical protein
MAYEDEIKKIYDLLDEFNIEIPQVLLDEQIFNNRLWDIFDDLSDIAYQNGRFDCDCDGEDYWS